MSSGILKVYVDHKTMARLCAIAAELDREITELAETSVSEAALNHFRGRKDDPAIEPEEIL